MHNLLYKLTANMPYRLISLDSGPYLERYYVGKLWGVTVYLHRFLSSDTEEHLHNHGWEWGRSLVLSGRYLEEVVTDLCPASDNGCVTVTRWVRWFNAVNGNTFHRICEARPNTWTLFMHGKRQRVRKGHCSVDKGWGFLERRCIADEHDGVFFVPAKSAKEDWWQHASTRPKD